MSDVHEKIASMSLWKSDIEITPVSGGITNQNYVVSDRGERYFVRLGEDIPVHGIKRFNELSASRAAHAAGISPAVIHAETGIMVLQYIDAVSLTSEDIHKPSIMSEITTLIQRCHHLIPNYLRGPSLVFWVFQVVRDYCQTLQESHSEWTQSLPKLLDISKRLEEDVGRIELVFGHNDLLAANIMNDGSRLWLIDWDYAGFNSPLFDLGGLASNNELTSVQELALLVNYFGQTPDNTLMKKYSAMKCASLLRETLWSMVSETHSGIDFDYHGYTKNNLELFQTAWQKHLSTYSRKKT